MPSDATIVEVPRPPRGAAAVSAVAAAGTAFLKPTVWRVAFASLRLPGWTPHPGSARMARASRDLREVAGRALAGRRQHGGEGNDLVGRPVSARDPATGEAMPDSLIIDNLVTILLAGRSDGAGADLDALPPRLVPGLAGQSARRNSARHRRWTD